MRLLVLLILISCSHQSNLKFKYSSAKRYLASLTGDDVVVSKITGELRHETLFASGSDSTVLLVRLYDKKGKLITDVDPSDLTLSTSEDVDAKPFIEKQGTYKSEILPRAKSNDIHMRVDWLERTYSQEIILNTTIAPLKDEMDLKKEQQFQTINWGFGRNTNHSSEGISFENVGPNKIVKSRRHPDTLRSFNFDYPEQAKQNLSMEVYDAPNGQVSQTMHSVFFFFPRKQMFVAEEKEGIIKVTIPTGEEVLFSSDSKEIVGGVFSEGPIDYNKDKTKRFYPDINYTGRGVYIRANARGQSPQLGEFEKSKIDMEYGHFGSSEVLISNGTTGQKCRRPKADFWEPIDVTPIEFKFPDDESLDIYLRNFCGFGLPKF